jgi:hypothetical protein
LFKLKNKRFKKSNWKIVQNLKCSTKNNVHDEKVWISKSVHIFKKTSNLKKIQILKMLILKNQIKKGKKNTR